MNVEDLREVAEAVYRDLQETGIVPLMTQLTASLNTMSSEPNNPNYQTQVSQIRSSIHSAALRSTTQNFSPRWKAMIAAMSLDWAMIAAVESEVDEAISENGITPFVAAERVTTLSARLQEVDNRLAQLLQALDYLNLTNEGLGPDDFELAVTVPRGAVHNSLAELGGEFEQLARFVGVLNEIIEQKRPPVDVRRIASSDFSVLVSLAPQVASALSTILDRLLTTYERILTIRQKRAELKNAGVSDAALSAVDGEANSTMETEIDAILRGIIELTHSEALDGRSYELHTELKYAVSGIANRIDKSFTFEVRVGERDSEAADSEAEPLAGGVLDAKQVVLANQAKARAFVPLGEPILALAEAVPGAASPSITPKQPRATARKRAAKQTTPGVERTDG